MASLPPIRRLLIEDFKNQKTWIGPLLLIVNNFMESVVNALNKSLTIVDNTTGDIRFVTLSSIPTASSPVTLSWTKPNQPVAVLVGQASLLSGANFTLSASVGIQWTMSSTTTLAITNVVGITPTATNQYQLTLVCLTG